MLYKEDKEKSKIVCQYLVSDSSPFKACRESNKLNFTNMYESCEYDVAVTTLDADWSSFMFKQPINY
jgi:hypothetical protein